MKAPGWTSESSIRKVKLETGEVLQKRDVPEALFRRRHRHLEGSPAELTWQAAEGLHLRPEDLRAQGRISLSRRRLGTHTDGKRIIMSDGTAQLRFWDPETLKETGRINVTATDSLSWT